MLMEKWWEDLPLFEPPPEAEDDDQGASEEDREVDRVVDRAMRNVEKTVSSLFDRLRQDEGEDPLSQYAESTAAWVRRMLATRFDERPRNLRHQTPPSFIEWLEGQPWEYALPYLESAARLMNETEDQMFRLGLLYSKLTKQRLLDSVKRTKQRLLDSVKS